MKRDKYVTAKNWLTHYALACGYTESIISENYTMNLYHDTGAVFHVRLHDHANGVRVFWESFETLPEARKAFANACREWGFKRKQPTLRGYKG